MKNPQIKLPGTKLAEINLDVNSTVLSVQVSCEVFIKIIKKKAPKYYLYHILPYKVKDKDGKAQWLAEKEILSISVKSHEN